MVTDTKQTLRYLLSEVVFGKYVYSSLGNHFSRQGARLINECELEFLRGNAKTDECEPIFKQYKACLSVSHAGGEDTHFDISAVISGC